MTVRTPHFKTPFAIQGPVGVPPVTTYFSPYKEAQLATAGLTSLWPLDETEGTSAIDAKSGFSGVYKEAPALGQASILPNGEGKSVKLNGTSQYITVADHEALRHADVFSLEGWIYPEAFGGDVFSTSHNGSVEVRAEEKFVLLQKEIAALVTATTKMTAATGYHLAITKNGATSKLYLTGVDVTGAVTNKTFEAAAMEWVFGRNGNRTEQFFKGRFQFFSIFIGTALSEATVKEHVAAASKPTEEVTLGSPASGRSFATVEQNSAEEIEQCVEAILRTMIGSRIDAPEFGIPDETFAQLGPEPSAEVYLNAIAEFEPRARMIGSARIEELAEKITIEGTP
jgi:phage baseplate assembly protein W